MRAISHLLILIMSMLALGLFISSAAFAEDNTKPAFVDLDGDGIDDNETDNDGNSIPDCFEGKTNTDSENSETVRSILGNVFNSDLTLTSSEDLRTNADKFGSLAFKTRGLPQRCLGFGTEDEFGSGSGIGLSSGSSGCAGGVCVR